jgi:glycosyltransferase involved in cell wall biosynthesis
MRIAQVAPLAESVPPEGYGGTERVVSYLTEELVRLGHDVTLFATADSETSAELEPMSPWAARSDPNLDPRPLETRMLAEAYRRSEEFDVIHCHTDYVGLPLAEHVTTQTVVTLHGRLDLPGLGGVFREFPNVSYVSISDSQRAPVPDINWVATVHHGLPARSYSFEPVAGDYLLFLGRISPEKCPDRAIRIATRAGVPLRIAAKVDAVDREYFEAAVRPLLDDPLVDFIGEVSGEQKVELLAHALALLFPIDWPEPFGLVMIEALACGTRSLLDGGGLSRRSYGTARPDSCARPTMSCARPSPRCGNSIAVAAATTSSVASRTREWRRTTSRSTMPSAGRAVASAARRVVL